MNTLNICLNRILMILLQTLSRFLKKKIGITQTESIMINNIVNRVNELNYSYSKSFPNTSFETKFDDHAGLSDYVDSLIEHLKNVCIHSYEPNN